MNKINGYTEEEAKNLVEYIKEGKRKGKTLTYLFETYGVKHGRAKGSVRNYYYGLLKDESDGAKELLSGKNLKAGEIKTFSDEETDKVLKAILEQKSKGVSVRRAVLELAQGDGKLMLRYQNKYRNTMAKEPEKIEKMLQSCKIDVEKDARKVIEEQIDNLYDRLALSLREENKRLGVVIKRLTDENRLLKQKIKNLQA